MPDPIRISAKTLGAVAMPDFCPRCFWIQMHVEKLPFQIFPGIFNSIDSYGKKLVHGWFDRHGSPPPWLAKLGKIRGYRTPPHFTKFQVRDAETSIHLRGTPDGILVLEDGSHLIIDYKTAKFTKYQDDLFPMYEAQLNTYGYIGERCGLSPVSGLALIYTEPVTDDEAAGREANLTKDGFVMEFSAQLLQVDVIPELVPRLLRRVREIHDSRRPPRGVSGCEDCARLRDLISVAEK